MSEELLFTLLYIILSVFIVYPPVEFISAGFTIPVLFGKFLGSEEEEFIIYHIRKSILTLLVYSFIPLGYIILLTLTGNIQEVNSLFASGTVIWEIFVTTSLVLPILAIYQIAKWSTDNFKYHPITTNLAKFCNNNNTDWKSVAVDIDVEFRRIDKISIQTNPITKIIATENWIIKITPLTLLISHQSDSSLVVKEAETHQISLQNNNEVQYLNIEVKSSRRNVEPFILRINATDFKDLEDRIARRIRIPPNVKFHKSVIEQFIDVFKETVKSNQVYETNQELDQCIGCLQAKPNVKLQKLCETENSGPENCTTCYCKPMWCIDCMAKWFASRQSNEQQSTWLSSKCTCPLCRAKFCILDVCLLPITDNDNE